MVSLSVSTLQQCEIFESSFSGAIIAFVGNKDARAGSAGAIVLFLGVYLGAYASRIVAWEKFMDWLNKLGDTCSKCEGTGRFFKRPHVSFFHSRTLLDTCVPYLSSDPQLSVFFKCRPLAKILSLLTVPNVTVTSTLHT